MSVLGEKGHRAPSISGFDDSVREHRILGGHRSEAMILLEAIFKETVKLK